jgi:hypothetical protein
MTICQNSASNIIAKNATMVRARKVVMPTTCCLQNIKNQWISMKICQKSALILYVKIVTKNIRITLVYGDIKRSAMT